MTESTKKDLKALGKKLIEVNSILIYLIFLSWLFFFIAFMYAAVAMTIPASTILRQIYGFYDWSGTNDTDVAGIAWSRFNPEVACLSIGLIFYVSFVILNIIYSKKCKIFLKSNLYFLLFSIMVFAILVFSIVMLSAVPYGSTVGDENSYISIIFRTIEQFSESSADVTYTPLGWIMMSFAILLGLFIVVPLVFIILKLKKDSWNITFKP